MATHQTLPTVTWSLVLLVILFGVVEGTHDCTNDTTCVQVHGSSFCDNGTCVCSTGYIQRKQVCSRIVPGDPCLSEDACIHINNSVCLNKTCTCLPLFAGKKCNRKSCSSDKDCEAIHGSACVTTKRKQCRCKPGFFEMDGRCDEVTLGFPCVTDAMCAHSMTNAKCVKSSCQCAAGYINSTLISCRPRVLGDPCAQSEDCGQVFGNVICVPETKICLCDSGFKATDQSRCSKILIGDNCASDLYCDSSVAGSVCAAGRCMCSRIFSANSERTACYPKQLGDSCAESPECNNVTNAECGSGGVCVCEPGYTDKSMVCVENIIGDACGNDDHCRIANSLCKDTRCTCERGWAPDVSNSSCNEQLITDTDCVADDDCLELYNNSVCNGRLCECEQKYFLNPVDNVCDFVYIGDACNQSLDCTISVDNSLCSDQFCACSPDHLPSDDRMFCRIKKLQGMECSREDHCPSVVPLSFCDVNKKCSCVKGYKTGEGFDACVPKRLLLDACEDDADCLVSNPYSLCSPVTGRCVCRAGFSLRNRTDGSSSTQAVRFKDTPAGAVCEKRVLGVHKCDALGDCLPAVANSYCRRCNASSPGSPCDAATCQCVDGYYSAENGTRCQGRLLGERCARVEDCSGHVPYSNCTRGVCSCSSGFKPVTRDSCQKKTIGDRCYGDVDCENAVDYSLCAQGVCVCKPGHYGTHGSSECKRRRIGDNTCAVDPDCSASVNDSYCRSSQCVCKQGFYPSATLYECFMRHLGDYCSLEMDCKAAVQNSVCKNHTCVCSSGFYDQSIDTCVKRKVGDPNCKVDLDCSDAVNNSVCAAGGCQCKSGFYDDLNFTVCLLRTIGAVCRRDLDCEAAVDKSLCSREGRCVCEPGHQSSSDGKFCSKRKVGSGCSVDLDCEASIPSSNCSLGICACMPGYDVQNNTDCVQAPTHIGSECHNTEQCRKIDPSSTCSQSSVTSRCWCPDDTFVANNRSMCIKLPALLEDACARNEHCSRSILNSWCDMGVCSCPPGHIPTRNNTGCYPVPAKLGDYCRNDTHCADAVSMTECDITNNTCVCQYGYTELTNTLCTERPRLQRLVPAIIPAPIPCNKKCDNLNNSICVQFADGHGDCKCDFRFARRLNESTCVPVQTYELTLHLTEEAKTYDYFPLEYNPFYNDPKSPEFIEFAERVSQTGLEPIFFPSALGSRYVSSNVTEIANVDSSGQSVSLGVKVTALIHLTAFYLNATSSKDIYSIIKNELESNYRVLGKSGLKIQSISKDSFTVTDYDECALKERNDCSQFANCLNTVGSFMCVCKPRYEDMSAKSNLRPGRDCEIPNTVTTVDYSELCSSDDCETKWEYVALALTLFLLIVMSFITYEIIQRKQDFSARKLYEKFGTTKIRKLRQASMKRIQESKRKRREEIKRKKEDKKKKKEEEKNQKNEEKKLKTLARKETKKVKKDKGRKGADGDVNEDEDNTTPSTAEIVYPPSFAEEEICHINITSLPGGTGDDDRAPRIAVSPIEESPV